MCAHKHTEKGGRREGMKAGGQWSSLKGKQAQKPSVDEMKAEGLTEGKYNHL